MYEAQAALKRMDVLIDRMDEIIGRLDKILSKMQHIDAATQITLPINTLAECHKTVSLSCPPELEN